MGGKHNARQRHIHRRRGESMRATDLVGRRRRGFATQYGDARRSQGSHTRTNRIVRIVRRVTNSRGAFTTAREPTCRSSFERSNVLRRVVWSCNQKCYYHTPFFARTPPNEPANVVSVFSSLPTTRVRALRAVPLPLRMVVVGSNCFVPVLTTPAQAHALERALKQLLQGEAQGGSGGCPAAVGGQQR